jgi:hypothetical protein
LYLDKRALEFNKGKILTALKNAKVGSLTLWYFGEKNSGHFEDIRFLDFEGCELPDAPLKAQETRVLSYSAPADAPNARPKIKFLGMAVSDLIYHYVLDQLHPGWAYGAGCEGHVEFDALKGVIRYRHKPTKKRAKVGLL